MNTTAPTTNTLILTKEGRTIRVIDTTKGPRLLKVFFSGPFVDDILTLDQEEKPYWTVIVAYEEDAPNPRYSYRIYDFDKAASLALKISQDQGLEMESHAREIE